MIKLGEEEGKLGSACELPHPACLAPKASGHPLGIPVLQKQLWEAGASLVCVDPTHMPGWGRPSGKATEGTGTPVPQE